MWSRWGAVGPELNGPGPLAAQSYRCALCLVPIALPPPLLDPIVSPRLVRHHVLSIKHCLRRMALTRRENREIETHTRVLRHSPQNS
eukprot:scaffold75113_cov40-Attheya_sp.AAC.1